MNKTNQAGYGAFAAHAPGLVAHDMDASETAPRDLLRCCDEFGAGRFDDVRVHDGALSGAPPRTCVNRFTRHEAPLRKLRRHETSSNLCVVGPECDHLFVIASTSACALRDNVGGATPWVAMARTPHYVGGARG
jgi:sugar lactone lactonase YvrE